MGRTPQKDRKEEVQDTMGVTRGHTPKRDRHK
jgi:hypothetical protein